MRATNALALFFVSFAYAQLHTLAKSAGLLYFGTATDNPANDPAYSATLSNTSDFGQITPANQQKWDSIEPDPGSFTFIRGDGIVSLAENNRQILRCHTLVWHQQLPSWVSGGTWTKATLTTALENHITETVTHYKGQCYAWDVVNEALNDNGTFRNDVFFNVLGEDYIKIAFESAAAADPAAKLYYNDFSIETPSPKTTAALNIVKSLKAAGTRIDGVGFQSHFIVGATPSKAAQTSNMQSFTALGVEVALTELDIRMQVPSTPALLTQQSTDYHDSVSACLAVRGCVGVTVWDFGDKYSWVPSTFTGFGAADLFDEEIVRKPAYFGVVAALAGSATSVGTNRTRVDTISRPSNGTTSGSPNAISNGTRSGDGVAAGPGGTGVGSAPRITATPTPVSEADFRSSAAVKSSFLQGSTMGMLFVLSILFMLCYEI
ncbi:glycoside hydrolase superfamily [Bisporella sp. PMI_857]|nr:glycoside hydrolase superfamily [Bisporella sp. PMI_857]